MPYDSKFFNSIGGGARQSAEVVLPLVFTLTGVPQSVLDVGCGTGGWLCIARRLGVEEIYGVDGYAQMEQLEIDSSSFRTVDLSRPVRLDRKFDLVMSLEVAEHLAGDSAETFIETLTRHADVVLFSAAIPGQRGEGHLNEQPASYWIGLFKRNSFELFDVVRPKIWQDDRVEFYYRQNCLLFAHGDAADRLRAQPPSQSPVDIVHPAMLEMYSEARVLSALNLLRGSIARGLRKRRAEGVVPRRPR